MLIRKPPLAVACLVLAPPVAWAQEKGNVEGEAELGILLTSGNTEETKVNGRLALKHETRHGEIPASSAPGTPKPTMKPPQRNTRLRWRLTTSLMINSTGLFGGVPGKMIASPDTTSNPP